MRPEGVDDDLPEQALALSDIMAACLTLKDGVRRNAYNATHDAASAERDAPPSAQSAGLSNQGNAPVLARANDLSSSAILREAPVDLRVAPLARDPERIRDRAKRSAADDAHWAEDATLGVRYVAMILDTMIVFIRLALFAALRGLVFRNTTLWYLLCATTLSLVTFALKMLYCAWGECGRHRATLGKRMMSLQVVRMDGETGVSVLRAACCVRRAAVRYGWRLIGSYALMLGYLMAFFTERKQALHDKLTDTVVVSVRPRFASPVFVVRHRRNARVFCASDHVCATRGRKLCRGHHARNHASARPAKLRPESSDAQSRRRAARLLRRTQLTPRGAALSRGTRRLAWAD